MKSINKLERRIKAYSMSRIKNSRRTFMPDDIITSHLLHANNDQNFWFQYFANFYDLFATIDRALLKAKTYSVALCCQWLVNKRGCSIKRLYEIINREKAHNRIFLDQDLLSLENLTAFIESIEQLRVIDE